mmetsp:Transcript_12979/g.25383  ORF Transcript_12979/g.25383 Transcript_12979/m.25383 type:complete len:146 (-) Transcript_12979:143-580(-)
MHSTLSEERNDASQSVSQSRGPHGFERRRRSRSFCPSTASSLSRSFSPPAYPFPFRLAAFFPSSSAAAFMIASSQIDGCPVGFFKVNSEFGLSLSFDFPDCFDRSMCLFTFVNLLEVGMDSAPSSILSTKKDRLTCGAKFGQMSA